MRIEVINIFIEAVLLFNLVLGVIFKVFNKNNLFIANSLLIATLCGFSILIYSFSIGSEFFQGDFQDILFFKVHHFGKIFYAYNLTALCFFLFATLNLFSKFRSILVIQILTYLVVLAILILGFNSGIRFLGLYLTPVVHSIDFGLGWISIPAVLLLMIFSLLKFKLLPEFNKKNEKEDSTFNSLIE